MNIHRTGKSGCEIAINHFTNICPGAGFTIHILEKLEGNGYINGDTNEGVDPDMLNKRLDREDYWIKSLRTISPYGLNERTKKMNKLDPIGTLFNKVPRYGERYHVTERQNRANKDKNITLDTILQDLSIKSNEEKANFLRKRLASLSVKIHKKITIDAKNKLETDIEEGLIRWLEIIIDTYFTKVYKKETDKKECKVPKIRFPVYFHNKGIEYINLQNILHQNDVLNCLPINFKEEHRPCVIFKLTPPIRNKILNYKEVVENIDKNDISTYGTGITECNCKDSEFCDPSHGHIITGNLQFITNSKLRKLFSKGPNYREPKIIKWDKAMESIRVGLQKCEEFLKREYTNHDFSMWKECILNNVENKICSIKQKVKVRKTTSILNDLQVKQYLNSLHEKYVIVPIDKASSNLAIICKKYYTEIILKELGVLGERNNTYVLVNTDDKNIIKKDKQYCQKLKIKQGEDNEKLPIMYWTPKMHKNPVGKRFIVASKKCSLKPLAKIISSIFKMFYYQMENFHKSEKFLANYNQFWVLKNANPIIQIINNINRKKNAKSICTYDFSTLYTNILHESLITTLNKLIDFVFKGGKKEYVCMNWKGEVYSGNKSTKCLKFDKELIKDAVPYVINNCHFSVGNFILRQSIGIPMGSDPSPWWANLYLYSFEVEYMKKIIKNDKVQARSYHGARRFIDDVALINDGGNFSKFYKEIYPPELELKLESSGTQASFLNLYIEITEGIFKYKLYDKRDDFPFSIVRMPYKESNIPENIFYSALSGEIIRIGRSTLLKADFLPKIKELIQRIKNQGASYNRIRRTIRKVINKHGDDFKFKVMENEIVDLWE